MKTILRKKFGVLGALFLCLLFQACSIEDLPLYRVRVKIDTSNKSNANTNDLVYVQLTKDSHKFYLDYGRNDFEKSNSHYYDIIFPGVYSLKDITRLRVGKNGSNGLCIERVRLYINDNELMFDKNYGNSNCHWLDNSGSYQNYVDYSYSDLRDNVNWKIDLADLAYPEEFSPSMLEDIIEGVVGNAIHEDDMGIRWGYKDGSEYVNVTRKNSTTHNVNLDLKYDTSYENWRGKMKDLSFSVDVDFELKWRCVSDEFRMETQDMEINIELEKGPWWIHVLDFILPESVKDNFIDGQIGDISMMDGISQSLGECPDSFSVDSRGNLEMSWPPLDLGAL